MFLIESHEISSVFSLAQMLELRMSRFGLAWFGLNVSKAHGWKERLEMRTSYFFKGSKPRRKREGGQHLLFLQSFKSALWFWEVDSWVLILEINCSAHILLCFLNRTPQHKQVADKGREIALCFSTKSGATVCSETVQSKTILFTPPFLQLHSVCWQRWWGGVGVFMGTLPHWKSLHWDVSLGLDK